MASTTTDITKRLNNRLNKLLKNDFWAQFMEALAEEIVNLEDDLLLKEQFNQIDNVGYERLLQIADKFGYTPNLILDNSIDNLRQEVKSITYRIKNKSTLNGYLLPFKMISMLGQTFSVFYDGVKLIRDINYEATLLNFGTLVNGEAFTDVVPVLYPSHLLNQSIALDDGLVLDAEDQWYLDLGLVKRTTQHLAVEYKAYQLYTEEEGGEEFLILPEYYNYLCNSVLYNKESTTSPHCGINLNMITDQSGYFNSNNRNSDYTIDEIKLKTSITNTYRSKLISLEEIFLDEGRELDETITWNLDQEAGTISEIEPSTFFYVTAGTGLRKGQLDFNLGRPYDLRTIHYGFDEYSGDDCIDSSRNEYDAKVNGTVDRIEGIIGKTVDFDGSTSVDSVSDSIIVSEENKTIQLWIKIPDYGSGIYYIFNHEYLEAWIDQDNYTFNVKITGTSGNETATISSYSSDNQEHIIHIEVDILNTALNVFQDTVLETTQDISTIGTIADSYSLNIGWNGTDSYFNGLIDDFISIEKILTDEEKTYIYENKLGTLKHLSNIVYREELSVNEVFSNEDYFFINTVITSNTVKNRFIAFGDSSTQTFTGNLKQTDIKEGTLIFSYFDAFGDKFTAYDNGQGEIFGEKAVGVIDYDTGDFSLTTKREYTVIKDNSTEGAYTSVSYNTNNNVKPSSVAIDYMINGTTYIGTDDGAGNITGTDIDTGTINYETGIISLTFNQDTDDQPIWTSYVYIKEDTLATNTELTASFSVNHDLEISEIGIENDNKELLVYSTNPSFKFGTNQSHIGVQLIIAKT